MSWQPCSGQFPVARSVCPSAATKPPLVPLLLDTDIGTNVDDLLALVMAATAPEIELVGVTTVYGDTTTRAKVAARVLEMLGEADVPVAAGEASPLSGSEVFWAGHEGQGYGDLSEIGLPGSRDSALELIGHSLDRFGSDLVIAAIGPLTNVCLALEPRAQGGGSVPRCVLAMAGQFGNGLPDTNVRADAEAARRLAACGIPVVYVGIELCREVPFTTEDLAVAAPPASGDVAAMIRDRTQGWWDHLGRPGSNPCDPLTLLALMAPQHFRFQPVEVRFDDDVDAPGTTHWRPMGSSEPPVRAWRASHVDVSAAREGIRERLRRAVLGRPQ